MTDASEKSTASDVASRLSSAGAADHIETRDAGPRPGISDDLGQAVGQVPILRLRRAVVMCERHSVYMKLESCNPGGSIKEKNAAYLIDEAEKRGLLKPGGTIVESSSGNFGIGLASIGAARGYRVVIVVDKKTSPTMRRILSAYGAILVDVPMEAADANGSMQVARMQEAARLAKETSNSWYPCQHLNPLNPDAHSVMTAREIEAAFSGVPDAIVVGISTAGQLAGLSRYLLKKYPQLEIVGVDVAGSAILGTPQHPYKMTGLGLSFVPPNFDPSLLHVAYSVSDQLAFSMCHVLARREGLLLGASTGAIMVGACAYAARHKESKEILVINPDRGDRYLETIYNADWLESQNIRLLSKTAIEEACHTMRPIHLEARNRENVALA